MWLEFFHATQHAAYRVGTGTFAGLSVAADIAILEQCSCFARWDFLSCCALDNVCDAFQHGAFNLCSSVAACLHEVSIQIPHDNGRVPFLDLHGVIDPLRAASDGPNSAVVGCPPQALNPGVAHLFPVVSAF